MALRTALRTRWYSALERSPRVYLPFVRRRFPEAEVVDGASTIVIEGYPSSANTFAREAFLLDNRWARTATHVHSWTQIATGARLGKPVILLVRPARDAVASHVLREPGVSIKSGLHRWLRFYAPARRFADATVVAPFSLVTSDFGAVVKAVNDRFGTSFVPFEHTKENADLVFKIIDDGTHNVLHTVDELWVARPSSSRDAQRDAVASEMDAPALRPLLERCDELYAALASRAP